ncbi:MAG: Dynamin family protein [Microcystis panniformis Mp_MB_F_20051200_S9]|uniref:Dynamin family protein n=1 Tax=Microcystis panniformis Mp_MB_F_20051200_S9 TaxID=2486223 RepID=A0A552PI28_9CHRO|nr:MAG: Dynamin family protein [Microcystis panniformis Mp_MB_F_20080800_S26D]TRV49157.1 MAG: Dynamin family protein [Microcystis panniformis Mp_GB_SS_20050300_S99D]TRV53402.1 MAG: Dynamin family protein [Microcystis panniformis Mp_GB_SS_20050300_S99]TRV55271.1 MAG: Dynamin family protein [Microcystis panniformis Mp_MB_F_20080800_S26]TRV56658.1 MAG: Dynamin family protein [Microcystis panniformis Mp_MB_F_20051200_S9]TRV63686.1 MAG: Dynamin family protein [Microcystis panniformis Mp_MB_F_200512
MDWKSASSYYENRLSDVLNIQHFAVDLAKLPQAEVPSKLTEILLQEAIPANRQLERLRKREFRIAVVGLEKAGKSTFINAWLECDLLPAKGGRCTFTTTQIYSVKSESEQRLEVQTRSEEQFNHLLKELETVGAKEDLNTIRENEITLKQVRQKDNLVIPFTRLEDIREQLKKYVADEKYAHAVLEARLYTNKLAQAEGIVFYDVPGSDSGLAKHVDEAQQMLSDCDAVIVIQRFRSIREAELEIIKFTEQGDKNVTIADKLFVFLSHIDSLGSPEALKTHITEASRDWLKRANLPVNRIVSGSAGAYLILNNLAEEHTQLEIGKASNIQDKLKTLTGIIDDEMLRTQATGIPEIKQKIFNYINTERVAILKKRCEASIDKIVSTSEDIHHFVSQRFPENPEEAQRFEEERRRIDFSEWWHRKWEQIKADLQNFYETSAINKPLEKVNNESSSSIEKFKERYGQLLASEMANLRQETLRKKEIIFDANSFPDFDKAKANYAWRDDLYGDVRKFLDALARQLAAELKDEALKLVDYMSSLLWGSSQVKERLIGYSEQEFLTRLENSLSVLFLRFARPVAEALIRGPVNSDTRSQIVKSLGADVELIDNYYQGDEPAFRVLKKYVKYGSDLLFDPNLRQQVLGVTEIAKNVIGMTVDTVGVNWIDLADQLTPPREVVTFEVTNDINAFEEYLRHGIFEAAGFESYCIQELRGLVDIFREKEGTWAGVAQNEWYKENPQLVAELPANLKSQEFNLEVSERLRQLAIALKRNSSS